MKKVATILVAAAILLCGIPAAAAVKPQSDDNIRQLLATLNIMNGYPDGSFYPDEPVTRAQFAKIAVSASTYRNTVSLGTATSPFRDVSYSYWGAPYIKVASVNKLLTGYPDSTFMPESNVLLEEAVTVLVKLLGYSDTDFTSSWPYGQLGVAANVGLLDNLNVSAGQALSRGDVSRLMYNLLCIKAKSGTTNYIESLNYKLIEDVTVIATAREDLSVGADKVVTSSGTYKINHWFDFSIVGKKGDIIIKDGSELVLFFAAPQQISTYNIYSVVGDKVVLYQNGQMASVDVDTSLTLYYKSTKTTIEDTLSKINPGDVLTLYSSENGLLDYGVMNESKLIGPYTVKDSGWISELGVSENAAVTRDGSPSSIGSVKSYDVVYYSPDLSTVWAYSKKVTGIYEKATPNREQISSAVISGVTYSLNSVPAFAALGAGGKFNIGDTVTLLIGRDGSIVDAIAPQNANIDTYVVYSTLSDDVIVYSNGNITQLNLDKNTTAYFNSNKTTLGSVISSLEMGYMISVCKNTDGSIDYVTINSGKISGPVTANGSNWQSNLNVSDGAVILRDGKKVSADSIVTYDVVYYSKDMNMVWAYSKKVTGVYEKATPNKDSITSVTVSGTTYSIETAAAMSALSSSGAFALGDNVTLLLGKDGKIADVISPSNVNEVLYGYLVSVGNKTYTDVNGNTVTSYYVKVALSDGTVMDYISKSKYDSLRCSAVRLSFVNGVATVSKVTVNKTIEGVFDYKTMKIGSHKMASDVRILDVGTIEVNNTGSYVSVFPQRLDGVTIRSTLVLYYITNSSGEITDLILSDVTGDAAQYGIIKEVSGNSYSCMAFGTETTVNNSTKYLADAGQPVKFTMSGTKVDGIIGLTQLNKTIKGISTLYIETDDGQYLLSDKVVVYNSKYMTVPLSDVIGTDKYRVEAYYDKYPDLGGRIRVLKVFEK